MNWCLFSCLIGCCGLLLMVCTLSKTAAAGFLLFIFILQDLYSLWLAVVAEAFGCYYMICCCLLF